MSDIRSRLRNLRAVTRPPVRYEPIDGPSGEPEALDEGELHETPHGASYLLRTLHPPEHEHGDGILDGWLTQTLAGAAVFTQDRRLATVDPRRCLFLDTETTGLSAGAGTLVFLVGLGRFTDAGFEVRQYFLRSPAEEPAMLHAIREMLESHEALVTFNGRSFDMPLLASRYTMNREYLRTDRWPNLDLLFPARRLWKRRLASCRLSALETSVLGVRRTDEDVPGWLIPQLYQDYLHTGDARQMRRVMYHNLYDILSMVTLAAYICDTFGRGAAQTSGALLPHDDLLSLARWYENLGMTVEAETMYRSALKVARQEHQKIQDLGFLAAMYKRQERRHEAEALWQTLAELSPNDPDPHLELAKFYEWTTGEYQQALHWTEAAERANASRPRSYEQQITQAEIDKRKLRLLNKLKK